MMEFIASSGAQVVINPGSWEETDALRDAIFSTCAGLQSSDSLTMGFAIESSPAVKKAVYKCLERCTYNGQKITKATFEDVTARQDYAEIVRSCIEVNQAPFPKSPISPFLAFFGIMEVPLELPQSE